VLIDRIADTVPPFRPEPHPIRVQAASDGRG
jgi:hypothetical protein